jgi:hypothetical protein
MPAATEDTEPICERCIWNLDHEGLIRTGPCNANSWAGSVQKELLENTIAPDLSADPGPFAAYMRCAAISMIKDEADIIGHNLRWLFHSGVRRFVLMDNISTDGTLSELQRFQIAHPTAEILVLRDPVVAHYQAEKVTAMAQLAKAHWPDIDWILPVDADEFCIARHGFQALAYVPQKVQALTIPKTIHFLPAGAPHEADANPMARMSVRSALFCVPPKVFLRARPGLGVSQGNHKVIAADGSRICYSGGFQWGFYHREFQTRSFAQFLRKVRNGGAAILAARAENRDVGGEHWMAWHEVLSRDGEAGLRTVFESACFRTPDGRYVTDPFPGAPEA